MKNNTFKRQFCVCVVVLVGGRGGAGGLLLKMKDAWPQQRVSVFLRHRADWCQSMSLSHSLSFSHPHSAKQLPLGTVCERERERARESCWWIMCADLSGSILFFVTSTLCSAHLRLSSPLVFFFFILSKYPSNLHHRSFALHLFIHPSVHPSLPWLTVVSCRDAVNNSSDWVVLSFLAAHLLLAVVLKNIWRRARWPHMHFHQCFQLITSMVVLAPRCNYVRLTVCNFVVLKYEI